MAQAATPASSSPPLVAVVVVIFTVDDGDLQALLISRSGEPYQGRWAVPGGRLNPGESLVEAATRKLVDETGVRDVYLEQLYTFSDLDDVTPGGSVAVTYFALVDHQRVRLADRTDWQPAWFSMRTLSLGIIEATAERQAEGAGRPALLYRFSTLEPVAF